MATHGNAADDYRKKGQYRGDQEIVVTTTIANSYG